MSLSTVVGLETLVDDGEMRAGVQAGARLSDGMLVLQRGGEEKTRQAGVWMLALLAGRVVGGVLWFRRKWRDQEGQQQRNAGRPGGCPGRLVGALHSRKHTQPALATILSRSSSTMPFVSSIECIGAACARQTRTSTTNLGRSPMFPSNPLIIRRPALHLGQRRWDLQQPWHWPVQGSQAIYNGERQQFGSSGTVNLYPEDCATKLHQLNNMRVNVRGKGARHCPLYPRAMSTASSPHPAHDP